MRRRLRISKGQNRKKTATEMRCDILEKGIRKEMTLQLDLKGLKTPAEVTNKGIAINNISEVNKEKLRGRFKIKMNGNVPMNK